MAALGVIIRAALSRFLGWMLAGLSKLFNSKIATWAATIFAWLGLQVAFGTFAFEPLIDQVYAFAQGIDANNGNRFATAAMEWLGFLKFDKVLTMLISAHVIDFAAMSGRVFLRKV